MADPRPTAAPQTPRAPAGQSRRDHPAAAHPTTGSGGVGGGVKTVTLGLDGVLYDIGLDADRAAVLRPAADRVDRRRPPVLGPHRRPRGTRRRDPDATRSAASLTRAWAVGARLLIADRGRIPANVIDAYPAAHTVHTAPAPAAAGGAARAGGRPARPPQPRSPRTGTGTSR